MQRYLQSFISPLHNILSEIPYEARDCRPRLIIGRDSRRRLARTLSASLVRWRTICEANPKLAAKPGLSRERTLSRPGITRRVGCGDDDFGQS
jgi:hypothetical protein